MFLQGGPVKQDLPYPRSRYVDPHLLFTQRRSQARECTVPQLAVQELHLNNGSILLISTYHRGGVAWILLGQVARITRGGTLPFLLYGDFNVSPNTLRDSQLPSMLNAVVVDTGRPTCRNASGIDTNIDYFMVSRTLEPFIKKRQSR